MIDLVRQFRRDPASAPRSPDSVLRDATSSREAAFGAPADSHGFKKERFHDAQKNTFPCDTQHVSVLKKRVGPLSQTCVAAKLMERHDKIRVERERRDWSQAYLGGLAGTNQQTVGRIEGGTNSKHLSGVLRALGLDMDGNAVAAPPEPILENYRPPPPLFEGTMPLYASAEGGKGHLIVSTDEIGRAPRPVELRGADHAYAILITGTSMIDTFEPGDRALVNPHLSPTPNTDCILYSVKDGEAKATIKRLVTWTDAEWTLKQNNPAKTFKLSRGIWQTHHQVVGNLKKSFGGRVPFAAT